MQILKKVRPLIVGALVINLSLSSGLHAESFKILGSRAVGMAGAFTAIAEDANASYWNPGAIAQQQYWDTETSLGARAEVTGGLLTDVNTISDFASKYKAIESAQTKGENINVDQFSSIFTTLKILGNLNQPGKGVLVDAQAGFGLRIMRLGFFANNFASVGISPFIDTVNVGLGKVTLPSAAPGLALRGATTVNLDGVSFNGVSIIAPSEELTDARNRVVNAINTVGYSNLAKIIGETTLTNNGITTSEQLANALVNEALRQNVTISDINTASQTLETEAPQVKDIIAAAANASNNGYANNTSNVTLRGINLFETGISYGHRFFVDDLYVGGSLKILHGTVAFLKKEFLQDDVAFKDISSDLKNNSKSSIQPGVDIGVLYDKRESWRTKFGLLARNINSPSFDQPDSGRSSGEGKYKVNPQLRAGLALYPFKRKFWVISADIDLTKNDTPVSDFKSQMWALGTEINVVNSNLLNVALRAGITSNLAEANSKPAYAAGLGIKILHFFVDASGSLSSKTETIKDGNSKAQDVPQNAQVAVSVGFNF